VFVKKAGNNSKIASRNDTAINQGGCKYASCCRYFERSSAACTSDEIASSYCGAYDLFDNFIVGKSKQLAKE
jgi:hypothetical protein